MSPGLVSLPIGTNSVPVGIIATLTGLLTRISVTPDAAQAPRSIGRKT